MAENDDDKEADVSKPSSKSTLDRVPLKIIIRRNKPNNGNNLTSSSVKTFKSSPCKNILPSESPLRPVSESPVPAIPVPASPVPTPSAHNASNSLDKRVNPKSLLPVLLLSKYADIAELMTAFETEKPKSLQEIWHSVRQHQLEEDNGDDNLSKYYNSGVCDFGADCEMPWLHPVIDPNLFASNAPNESKAQTSEKEIGPEPKLSQESENSEELDDVRFADWRHGAAKYWYDQLEVPEDGKSFTYGFKLKEKISDCDIISNVFTDDSYLMVSQLHWEDDVIWNGADIDSEVLKSIKSKWSSVGGKESDYKRTLSSSHLSGFYIGPRGHLFPISKSSLHVHGSHHYGQQSATLTGKDESWKSIFPFENENLVLGAWENEIIWDAENMLQIPKPKIPTLDPSDENIILGIPDDTDFSRQDWFTGKSSCVKLSHPYIKESKIVISKKGITNVEEEDVSPHFLLDDPFNVSNDSYYAFKSLDTSLRLKPVGRIIQHAIPVLELRPPFIPTTLGPLRLRSFHRPPLKRYSHGLLAQCIPHPVFSLSHEISSKAMMREEERKASGGGDVFFMREPEDLSGKDGELVLIEFSEEHPLLMNEVGMCSKIINYYKRKASKDQGPPPLRYGEVVYPQTSPFLGVLSQGQCVQAVENYLYRCPIYEHRIRDSDFLIVRTRNCYSIREVDAIFVAGQQCPLYEVPAPHTRCATNFTRDFLQVHIFRMLKECPDEPKWVKIDEVKKAFPLISDINIRRCLKVCADFKRLESLESFCWVLRSDFRLPSEEELRAMVTPEQCCAQFSMMAAEQRLKDAGYGANCLFVPPEETEDENEDGMQLKIDDEIKAAPWNLTRSFIQSVNGKCLLELVGFADPTGCGEGFSYSARPNRPGKHVVQEESPMERDQKPSANNARLLLRKMGVPEKEIKTLTSWELVDIARSLSKKRKGKAKVPKIKPMTTAEHLTKYKSDCQRIFDLQNQVLQSHEELSTDEEEASEEEGSDVEEMGKILEKLISDKKSYSELREENEEKEREELVKMMMEDSMQKQAVSKNKIKKEDAHRTSKSGRILKINRTFRDSNGREYTRVEFVRQSSVIDVYMKIRATKDDAFIHQFASLDSATKQKIMKEKRKIEGQLMRLKLREHELGTKEESKSISIDGVWNGAQQEASHNKEIMGRGENHLNHPKSFATPVGKKLYNVKMDPKRKCGACGNVGHKRGNRICPMYCGSVNVAMTEEEEEEYGKQLNVDDQNLVNVDGTKLKLSVKLIKRAEEMKRKTLVLRVPKDMVRKRKRPLVETHCDYLEKYQRPVNRRRVDPVVVLSNVFEGILNDMRDLSESDPFHFPVNSKVVPNYYSIISRPMDLQTIRENLRTRKYQNRKDFLEDVNQIVQNSTIFNGPQSSFTISANKMLDLCVQKMGEQEDELIRLEETINPSYYETDLSCEPQGTGTMPSNQPSESHIVSKSVVDLAMSEPEDDSGLLDVRACSVVP